MIKTVTMAENYSPNGITTFFKNSEYEVRDEGEDSESFSLWHRGHNEVYATVPKSYVVGWETAVKKSTEDLLKDAKEYSDDVWTLVHERTGVARQTVKVFFMKYWHEFPIPVICREERIRCQDVVHMISVFNEWADAIDPEDI